MAMIKNRFYNDFLSDTNLEVEPKRDVEAVNRLLEQLAREIGENRKYNYSSGDIAGILSRRGANGVILVIRDFENSDNYGKIVAMATLTFKHTLNRNVGWIDDVVVDEGLRRNGLGTFLVEQILHRAYSRKVTDLYLTSRETRVVANQFYLKLGFELMFNSEGRNYYRFRMENFKPRDIV